MKNLTRRQKIIYFSLALLAWMVFQHGLGPQLGLTGWERRIWAYVFAIILATLYLYVTLMWQKPHNNETDTDES